MQEIAVISGKGGTGKTSLVASFAAISRDSALADCDVDASDLHLILNPQIVRQEKFSGGKKVEIDPKKCSGCGKCLELCRFGAIAQESPTRGRRKKVFRIDPVACEGCGVCAWFCPEKAIKFAPAVNGEWFVSETRCGPMVHARLGVAEENSGKLVSIIREEARKVAQERGMKRVLIDGSPGTGCPVIASLTGATLALVVTEPTLSGLHDLEQVAQLTRHFKIPTLVCVNKWDINPSIARRIEILTEKTGCDFAGKIHYDQKVTEAQIEGKALVEYSNSECAKKMCSLWLNIRSQLDDLSGANAWDR